MARILIVLDLVVLAASGLAVERGSDVQAASFAEIGARPTAPQTSLSRAADGLRPGRTQEGVRILADAIRAARQRGETGSELAGALNDLGSIYHDTDRLTEAARCYSEAIAILKGGGHSNSNLLVAFRNLAGLRVMQARYSDAQKLYRDALELAVSEFGDNSSETASICNGLADTFLATRRYREARQFSERALALLETSPYDANKAVSLFILSKVAWQRGAKDEAESWLRRAVSAWETSVGVGHPSYASGLASLALVLSSSHPDESERLFQQALKILFATLGDNHSYSASVMLQYSRHLELHGRKQEAKELKRRADAILTGQSLSNGLGDTVDVDTLRPARDVISR
jgi:tetratricopeptide (TPR) repeat protein